ncbi:hypothetical protein RQP46_010628 [Phenoliferia psychrophenolica]
MDMLGVESPRKSARRPAINYAAAFPPGKAFPSQDAFLTAFKAVTNRPNPVLGRSHIRQRKKTERGKRVTLLCEHCSFCAKLDVPEEHGEVFVRDDSVWTIVHWSEAEDAQLWSLLERRRAGESIRTAVICASFPGRTYSAVTQHMRHMNVTYNNWSAGIGELPSYARPADPVASGSGAPPAARPPTASAAPAPAPKPTAAPPQPVVAPIQPRAQPSPSKPTTIPAEYQTLIDELFPRRIPTSPVLNLDADVARLRAILYPTDREEPRARAKLAKIVSIAERKYLSPDQERLLKAALEKPVPPVPAPAPALSVAAKPVVPAAPVLASAAPVASGAPRPTQQEQAKRLAIQASIDELFPPIAPSGRHPSPASRIATLRALLYDPQSPKLQVAEDLLEKNSLSQAQRALLEEAKAGGAPPPSSAPAPPATKSGVPLAIQAEIDLLFPPLSSNNPALSRPSVIARLRDLLIPDVLDPRAIQSPALRSAMALIKDGHLSREQMKLVYEVIAPEQEEEPAGEKGKGKGREEQEEEPRGSLPTDAKGKGVARAPSPKQQLPPHEDLALLEHFFPPRFVNDVDAGVEHLRAILFNADGSAPEAWTRMTDLTDRDRLNLHQLGVLGLAMRPAADSILPPLPTDVAPSSSSPHALPAPLPQAGPGPRSQVSRPADPTPAPPAPTPPTPLPLPTFTAPQPSPPTLPAPSTLAPPPELDVKPVLPVVVDDDPWLTTLTEHLRVLSPDSNLASYAHVFISAGIECQAEWETIGKVKWDTHETAKVVLLGQGLPKLEYFLWKEAMKNSREQPGVGV